MKNEKSRGNNSKGYNSNNQASNRVEQGIMDRIFSTIKCHGEIIVAGLVMYDAIAIMASFFLALWFRFDCRFSSIPKGFLQPYYHFILVDVGASLIIFWWLRLYHSIWKFASYMELLRTIVATAISLVFHFAVMTVFVARMPASYYIFGIIMQFCFVLGIRFLYRFVLLLRASANDGSRNSKADHVMLIGAGKAGQMILRDIKEAKETTDVVSCIIDDDINTWGRNIDGIPIVGGRDDILSNVEEYGIKKIFLAIPSATMEDKREILNICNETGCEMRNLPGVFQFVNGDVTVSSLKEVAVEDLLGREPIKVNLNEIFDQLSGKVCLVSGGGGSIGSELCRQIAAHKPKQLIILDIYENNAYDIQQELKRKYPELDLVVLVGSVRDSRRVRTIFEEYKPNIVYHAAAHKHVPLMEDSPCEAIKNNSIGTYKIAYEAMMNNAERFVLISTDKAVNPTNIMGASKRLCEMIVQSFDRMIKEETPEKLPLLFAHSEDEDGAITKHRKYPKNIKTEFVAVRFGNVLGSNGSVIPLFKKQIEEGGPVTVTHPDIIRYFMTIPEAVSLVLQAGAYAKGGEIFILDMGEPVKIDTLARNLIKLSGLKPDVDIKVEYTGLRPGEKLFEEKLMAEEGMRRTKNDLIHIGKPIDFDVEEFLNQLEELMYESYNNCGRVPMLVENIVPTYHPVGVDGDKYKRDVYKKMFRVVG